MVTRLDYQKGIDLVISALRNLRDQPWQAIILGIGNPVLEEALSKLEQELKGMFRPIFRFDPGLSRKIYAGADVLVMPSRYEPCGLAQMIAMRYGCVPIAHSTGGLRDTIHDDPSVQNGTGFLFQEPSGEALADTLHRALEAYKQPDLWQQIQLNGMRMDFSWKRSAREYLQLYDSLTISKDI
jgi:starch synthase